LRGCTRRSTRKRSGSGARTEAIAGVARAARTVGEAPAQQRIGHGPVQVHAGRAWRAGRERRGIAASGDAAPAALPASSIGRRTIASLPPGAT
jgi:hypothetical protein